VLAHHLHGQHISEVLAMSATAALEFFEADLSRRLATPILAIFDSLASVGLGYVPLGQALSTLSGGERQRLKLAVELRSEPRVLVLDEPTSGLHMADVDALLELLDRLVDCGRTVLVIEHNLDVVARADWVVDLGPGAGHQGGRIVYEGPPAGLVGHASSLTGQHLSDHTGV
jgi:excinuclease UvrABC ATPase subunit